MDYFLVFLRAKSLLDLGRFESFDFGQGVGRTIHETFGEFLAVRVEAADRVAGLEGAGDRDDAGGQETLSPLGQGFDGSLIDSETSRVPAR